MSYEIWVTDKSEIPMYIKTYPYKIQCWIWAMLHGFIYTGRNMYFKDERVKFIKVEERE